MNALEKTFWGLLKSHLPKGCDHQRIETGSTGRGIPDVNVCLHGNERWWELKIVKGKRIDLSPEQVSWHHRRARAGGVTFILARDVADGPRKGKYDRIYVWAGANAPEVLRGGLDCPPLAMYERPYDWDLIMKELFEL